MIDRETERRQQKMLPPFLCSKKEGAFEIPFKFRFDR